jgi:hypothetical protein
MATDAIVTIEVAQQTGKAPGAVAGDVAITTDRPAEEVERLSEFLGGLPLVPSSVRVRVDSVTPAKAALTMAVTGANIAAGEYIDIAMPGLPAYRITGVTSGAASGDGTFNVSGTSATAATNMAAAINTRYGLNRLVTASTNSADLIITAVETGPVGKTISVIDGTVNGLSPAGGSLASASGVGERAVGSITIDNNGNLTATTDTQTIGTVTLTWVVASANEDQVTIGASATLSGDNLATMINAHSRLSGIVSASNASGVVTLTYLGSAREGRLLRLAVSDATAQSTVAMAVTGTFAASQSTRTYALGAAT